MSTSIEKIHAMASDFAGPPNEDAEPFELVLRTAVVTIGPMFLELLPDDPALVDEGLEEMAGRLLALRSDHADVIQLANHDGTPLDAARGLPQGE